MELEILALAMLAATGKIKNFKDFHVPQDKHPNHAMLEKYLLSPYLKIFNKLFFSTLSFSSEIMQQNKCMAQMR